MGAGSAVIGVTHQGGDRLVMSVRGHEIHADQPVEDGGEDSAPTPTEIFLGSLAACVAFYAERFLRRHKLATEGLVVTCSYTWAANPTRIGGIDLSVDAPGLTAERREAFLKVVNHCTLHNTLEQPPEVRVSLAEARVVAA